MAGSLDLPKGTQVASADRASGNEPVIRAQSPDGLVQLGEPIRLTPTEGTTAREPLEVASNSDETAPRSRNGLEEPILTIDRLTTDAAKVVRD